MNINRIFWAGVAIWIVGTAWAWLTCGTLFRWVYELEPTALWRPAEVMMSGSNMLASLVVGLIMSILFVLVYAVLEKGIPGKGVMKGFTYAFLIWLVSALPGIISMPFYMNIHIGVVIYWIVNALIIGLINGAIVASMYTTGKK